MIVSLEGVNLYYGAFQVLKDIQFKIEDHDRIGLIGVNGAGKSSLLKLIYGMLQPDEGTISRNTDSIGYLQQNHGLNSDNTILQEMQTVFAYERSLLAQMKQLERQMAALTAEQTETHAALSARYADIASLYEARDGYQMEVRINTVLNGMGFEKTDREMRVSHLSGGEKTRLAICKLLLEAPKLLILDEPTNHLDFRTLTWLEAYLKEYKGAILLVSHDRYFLDTLVDEIAEIENHTLVTYKGNYSKYVQLKEERVARLQKEYEMQQMQIAQMQDYAARNIVRASTSASAKSRLKAIERMDKLEKPITEHKTPLLHFTYEREPVKDVLQAAGVQVAVGAEQKVLLRDVNLHIFRGEKVAVIGHNGVGKSSLLRILLGQAPSGRGEIQWGRNVQIAYFDQEDGDLHLDRRVIDELWDRYPLETELSIRSKLGSVLLTGENVYKSVCDLSGGERARLKFLLLMMQQPNVLVLDEPTNHLDLYSREVLDRALCEYTGTILMVSHDRYLLNKLPDYIVELQTEGMTIYPGRYDDYLARKRTETEQRRDTVPPTPPGKAETAYYRSKKQRSMEVQQKKKIGELENRISLLEQEILALEELISVGIPGNDYEKLNQACLELEAKKQDYEALLEEWSKLNEAE